jgi:CheY-like chemotaxis protein
MMKRLRVLIVDDDPEHRDIAVTVLRHVGYDTVEAVDGATALEIARADLPSLVLMDVRLPTLDGWTTTERLKSDPDTAGIPIIIFSAHALPEHRARSLLAGAETHLAKPCEPRQIVEEVRKHIGSAE